MKKDLTVIGGLLLVVLGLLIFGGGFSSMGFVSQKGGQSTSSEISSGVVSVKSKNFKVNAEYALTEPQRTKGLSGRDSLLIGQGLLFVFEQKGKYTFWMKDMKFPIDIIWIGDDKKIAYVTQNALPEPGKSDKDLTRYSPNVDSKYVLEINAGLAAANNLQVGDQFDFK